MMHQHLPQRLKLLFFNRIKRLTKPRNRQSGSLLKHCRWLSHFLPSGCLALFLLLGIFCLNPAAKSKSFALETAEANSTDTIEKGNNEPVDLPDDNNDFVDNLAELEEENNTDGESINYDDLISPLSVDSSINLTVTNLEMPATEVPADGMAYRSHNVTVNAVDVSNYSLTLSYAEANGALRLDKDNNATLKDAGTIGVTMTSMADDTWGWAWSDNLASGDEASLTYYGMPKFGTNATNMATGLLDTPAVNNFNVNFTKKLVFGAKFSKQAFSGTYHTSAILSLAAVPKFTAGLWQLPDGTTKDSGIVTMQSMTADVCNQVATPTASTASTPYLVLRDDRGGGYTNDDIANSYLIGKLRDGKCWMLQNLNITDKTMTSMDSNVSKDFILPASTLSWNDSVEVRQVYYPYVEDTGNDINKYGAYYNWYTATAGTNGSSASICPKGWRLPTGKDSGEFAILKGTGYLLVGDFSLNSNSGCWLGGTKADAPGVAFFPAAGSFGANRSSVVGPGTVGNYWSSTRSSDTGAYYLRLRSGEVSTNNGFTSKEGISVRCVAQ